MVSLKITGQSTKEYAVKLFVVDDMPPEIAEASNVIGIVAKQTGLVWSYVFIDRIENTTVSRWMNSWWREDIDHAHLGRQKGGTHIGVLNASSRAELANLYQDLVEGNPAAR
jgi:hypothetical protein